MNAEQLHEWVMEQGYQLYGRRARLSEDDEGNPVIQDSETGERVRIALQEVE